MDFFNFFDAMGIVLLITFIVIMIAWVFATIFITSENKGTIIFAVFFAVGVIYFVILVLYMAGKEEKTKEIREKKVVPVTKINPEIKVKTIACTDRTFRGYYLCTESY